LLARVGVQELLCFGAQDEVGEEDGTAFLEQEGCEGEVYAWVAVRFGFILVGLWF
tara:strand:- start:6864 stop:7028 length:165 start_codon:yes stop_codon:yes gene_type:complete